MQLPTTCVSDSDHKRMQLPTAYVCKCLLHTYAAAYYIRMQLPTAYVSDSDHIRMPLPTTYVCNCLLHTYATAYCIRQ